MDDRMRSTAKSELLRYAPHLVKMFFRHALLAAFSMGFAPDLRMESKFAFHMHW